MPMLPEQLYTKCWDHWKIIRDADHDFVVRDKIPIPFFGDVSAYMISPLRIVTVGVNPNDDVFVCTSSEAQLSGQETEQRLSSYFNERHQTNNWPGPWFGKYETVLGELDCSYRGASVGVKNTALHADMCSPIATAKWSKLSPTQKALLTGTGKEMFWDLLGSLRPHLLLMSVGKGHVQRVWPQPRIRDWDELLDDPIHELANGNRRRSPYRVLFTRLPVAARLSAHAIWGHSNNIGPFGPISNTRRIEIGRRAADLLTSNADEA